MSITRREFLSLLATPRSHPETVQVVVVEVFDTAGRSALLVHHADAQSRNAFAHWLRSNPAAAIRVRDRNGQEANAVIFRMRMCFGRGLILVDSPVSMRNGDVLTIELAVSPHRY